MSASTLSDNLDCWYGLAPAFAAHCSEVRVPHPSRDTFHVLVLLKLVGLSCAVK